MNKRRNKRYDKALKLTRDRYHSPKTQVALTEAVLAVQGTTEHDVNRIAEQIKNRLSLFKHHVPGKAGNRAFRAQVSTWASRQAELTVMLRQALRQPVAYIDANTAFQLLPDCPDDIDDADALRVWAAEITRRVQAAGDELSAWMQMYSAAVRSGIRKVLSSVRKLEGCLDDVEDELFSRTWMFVADHAAEFAEAKDLRRKLHNKGMSLARTWRKARIAALKDGLQPKPVQVDDFEALEAAIMFNRERRKLPPRLGPGAVQDVGDGTKGDAESNYVAYTEQFNIKGEPSKIKAFTIGSVPATTEDGAYTGCAEDDGLCHLAGAVFLSEFHNPPIEYDYEDDQDGVPWTDADLVRELRRAGPFVVSIPRRTAAEILAAA